MTGFSVYLDKLGSMAIAMNAAATQLDHVRQIAGGAIARDAANALGVIGTQSNWPARYLAACTTAGVRTGEGVTSFDAAAAQLLALEKKYAADEHEYARKFDVLDDGRDVTVPTLPTR